MSWYFRPLSWICTQVFVLAEDYNINLGRLTPWVIAGMVGSWPHKVENSDR